MYRNPFTPPAPFPSVRSLPECSNLDLLSRSAAQLQLSFWGISSATSWIKGQFEIHIIFLVFSLVLVKHVRWRLPRTENMAYKLSLCMSENIFILLSHCIASLGIESWVQNIFSLKILKTSICYLVILMWLWKVEWFFAFFFGSFYDFLPFIFGVLKFHEHILAL